MTTATRWRTPRDRRHPVVAVVALALALTLFGPDPAVATEQVDLGTFPSPLRIEAPEGVTVELDAGDRTHRLDEVIEIRRGGGTDLLLVNDVSMTTYVEGIAEMPLSWPMDALKAQAVAARTYGWSAMIRAAYSGYDICPTVACQVFRGRDVVEGPGGERWAAAVAQTEGEVLLHDGGPILARYFSTSGGRTRNNEDVFPSSGPRPYLKAVDDPEDEVSPLHTWEVRLTREEMDAILAEGEQLQATVPLERIEIIPAGGGHPDRVRVVGGGSTVVLNASTLRAHVARVAPLLFPDRFPTRYPGSERRLPETLPSSRFTVEVSASEVVFDGRGYGHGVGMSQYGAMGKAEAGMAYVDILAAYYAGLRPAAPAALPDRIRVGIETGAGTLTFRGDGPVRVVADGRTVTTRGMGTWQVTAAGGGLTLSAPAGFGATLAVAPTETSIEAPTVVHRVRLETVVNKPAELVRIVTDGDGDEVERAYLGVVEAGAHETEWRPDEHGPGDYEVALRAVDEDGIEEGAAIALTVRAPDIRPGRPETLLGPAPGQAVDTPALFAAGILGAVVGAIAGTRVRTGRRR